MRWKEVPLTECLMGMGRQGEWYRSVQRKHAFADRCCEEKIAQEVWGAQLEKQIPNRQIPNENQIPKPNQSELW